MHGDMPPVVRGSVCVLLLVDYALMVVLEYEHRFETSTLLTFVPPLRMC